MSVAHADAPGLGCHLRPYWYLRVMMLPVQPLRIMGTSGLKLWLRIMVGFVLMSMAHVTIISHESAGPGGLGTRELVPPLACCLIRRTAPSPVLAPVPKVQESRPGSLTVLEELCPLSLAAETGELSLQAVVLTSSLTNYVHAGAGPEACLRGCSWWRPRLSHSATTKPIFGALSWLTPKSILSMIC